MLIYSKMIDSVQQHLHINSTLLCSGLELVVTHWATKCWSTLSDMFVHQQEGKSLQACWINLHTTPYLYNTTEISYGQRCVQYVMLEKRRRWAWILFYPTEKHAPTHTYIFSKITESILFMVNYKNIFSFSKSTRFLQTRCKPELV